MGEREPVERENPDGTVDVWYRGWKLSFRDGAKPTFDEEEPPAGAAAATDVTTAGDQLRRGKWLVTFGADGPGAVDVGSQKKTWTTTKHFFYRGRHR